MFTWFGCDNKFLIVFSKLISSNFFSRSAFSGFFISTHSLSYLGASSANADIGTSHTIALSYFNVSFFESVKIPMTEKSKSHFLKIFSASFSLPVFKTISIRSWLSESIISYGVIPVSRHGTLFKSNSIPIFPFDAISTDEEVKPAAPIS